LSIQIDGLNPYAFKHRAMIFIAEGKIELACMDLETAEELGYAEFQNEIDANPVEKLIKEYCLKDKK